MSLPWNVSSGQFIATSAEVTKLMQQSYANPEVPPRDLTQLHLYTDGSCTDPTQTTIMLSAGAVNQMISDFDCVTIKANIVPGLEQSSARAELYAGIMALEVGYRVAIYTDYQLLHDRLNEFLRGNKPNSRWSNHDLWEILHDLTRTRNDLVTIHKVKAHNNWQLLEGEIRVQAWQNEQVDKAAKRTVHESPLFPKYLKITKILKEQELATMKYCDFLYSTAMDFFKTKRVKGEYREKFDVELLTVKGPGNKLPTDLTLLEELVTGETRFPVAFLEKIVKWSSLLSWGHDNMKNTIYDNIAWVELYIDFLISQQMHSPVKLPHHNPKKAGHFVLRTHPLGQHMTPCLGTDVYTFISAVKFLTRKHVISLPPTVAKATTSKLLGLSENYAGLNTRPRLVANLKAARWLQKTIIHQGAAHSSLNFVIGSMPE